MRGRSTTILGRRVHALLIERFNSKKHTSRDAFKIADKKIKEDKAKREKPKKAKG